tara:strand:- start:4527 stop:6794 length:2268 start_codon:yes stop_codon:yes gene_type:complete
MDYKELVHKLVNELSFRVGIPNVKDKTHQSIMSEILSEWGEFEAKQRIFEFLTEKDEKTPEDEKYKNTGGSGYVKTQDYDKWKADPKGDFEKFTKEGPGVYKAMEDDSKGGEEKEEKEQGKSLKDTSYQKIVKNEKKVQDKLDKEDGDKEDGESEKGTPSKKLSKEEDKQRVTKIHQESEKLSKKIYGEDLNTSTLQNSVTSDEIINKGYERDKYYTAPGNTGSAFNELLSNEITIVLSNNPNLSEDELTSILYHRFNNTKLAKQQSTSTKVESPTKKLTGVVPDGVEPHIWKSCIIAARSGKAKSDRATKGTKVAQEQVGFGSDTTTLTFGGTSRNEGKKGKANSKTPDDVITDLEALENEIKKSKSVYVYDDELGKMIEIPKDVITKWVASSGGGENAADTVVLTKDENGNVIFDGWSDKKGLADLQGNSTLNDDYTKQDTNVDTLVESGQIDTSTSETAKQIISDSKKKSKEIEDSYSDAPKKEAEYFRTLSGEQNEQVVQLLKDQEAKYSDDGTTNHVRNAMEYFKVDTHEELLDKLTDGNEKTSADRLKIVTRAADVYRKNLRAKDEEIPPGLDTKQILSDTRKKALDLQRETVDKLNEHSGKTKSGKTKRLGDMLGFQETIDFLHIDKIEKPKSDNDYKSALKRNTQLVMGGVPLKPKDLKDCLGVDNLTDYEDNFEVITEEKFIMDRDKESGKNYITGKTVLIYAINKGENKKTFVGEKSYRSKQGKTGKTGNTIKWSKEMQGCFDSK